MLTTVTTVFGLLPLACNMSIDIVNRSITAGGQMATFWGPLSQAIVFGLSFATILTLIATPALLALPASLRDRWRARRTHVASPVQSDLGSPGADPAPSQ
jgi:multidrug efflux pump